jgi:hypothetical protein
MMKCSLKECVEIPDKKLKTGNQEQAKGTNKYKVVTAPLESKAFTLTVIVVVSAEGAWMAIRTPDVEIWNFEDCKPVR